MEDDEERETRHRQQRPGRQSYYYIDRDLKQDMLLRSNALSTGDRDTVSGTYACKQPSNPNRENIAKSLASINTSGNRIVNSINSSTNSGNNKDSSVASQFALASSHSLKPVASVISKPSLSSVSEKPREISQKVKSVSSSSAMGNIHHWEGGNKGTNGSNDGRNSARFPPAASSFPFSEFSNSSTNGAGKSSLEGKTERPSSSSSSEKSKSPKPPPLSTKPTIAPSSSSNPKGNTKYTWVDKNASSTYVFPEEIKSLIEKDIVPGVLKMPLSKSPYKDYFLALMYAEDCYLEKWDAFEMKNVKVQLHEAAIYNRRGKNRNPNEGDDKDEKVFVAFELDEKRERRPFLISRDFVSLQPANWKIKTFQGVIYRVVKSNLVLAEFGEDFHSHHHPNVIYDVKFSFNRVCLKRAHHAVATASEALFRNVLFPSVSPKHKLPSSELFPGYNQQEAFAVRQILRLQGAPPYLVEGSLTVENDDLSITGLVIVEAILQIFRADPSKRILLCAPRNRTCDVLMRGLRKEIAESDMFRANAAFREIDGVPIDILPSCLYKDDVKCFSCPSLKELKKYKVISTTFMSSFRLYGEGIMAGHFSHIFLVDASFVTEPETMVPLTNFVTDTTVVVVTGAPGNRSGWVRSKIARENGLLISYFERLCDSGMYRNLDPKFIVRLETKKKY